MHVSPKQGLCASGGAVSGSGPPGGPLGPQALVRGASGCGARHKPALLSSGHGRARLGEAQQLEGGNMAGGKRSPPPRG